METNAGLISECIVPGTPYVVNNSIKQRMADCDEVFLQTNANGNLLNSSIIVRMNLFPDNFDDGNGPFKSIEILSNACVARISFPDGVYRNLASIYYTKSTIYTHLERPSMNKANSLF